MKIDLIVAIIIAVALTLQDFWPLNETLDSPLRWVMLFVWIISITAVVFGVMRLIRWWIDRGKQKQAQREAARQRSTREAPKPNRAQRRRMR